MRKHIIFGILIVVALLSFGMSDSKDKELNLPTIEQMEEERRLKEQAVKDSIANYHKVELDNFLSAIGFRESGNRYDITNTFGYMGKYQFGKSTLKGLGYKGDMTLLTKQQASKEIEVLKKTDAWPVVRKGTWREVHEQEK